MLRSMTGFGRAEATAGDKTFLIDIKSLNGKQFDLQLKMPAFLKPFEFDIRKILSENGSRRVGFHSPSFLLSARKRSPAR